MELCPGNIYHIYNQGNNKEKIFFGRDNYLYFLKKLRRKLYPHLEFLAYCLMPNHFHLMVWLGDSFSRERFTHDYRILLSSYTRAINKQEKRSGSLFRQNSRAKCLTKIDATTQSGGIYKQNYPLICFHYIHQNPLRGGLVEKMEDWEFSSFRDYLGLREGTLCNRTMAVEMLCLPTSVDELYEMSSMMVKDIELEKIL